MSRYNIEVDDQLLEEVMRRFGIRSKADAVDVALRRLADAPLTAEDALNLRGSRAIEAIPRDEFNG